ncbi:MoxR family ATPase [bacterium]|nr:MoxR family ATPase [bacterium]
MQSAIDKAIAEVGTVVLGKEKQIRMAICCLLAKGHLLLEDLPGMGKTTLSHALAAVLGLDYQRVQFTSDLLPSDITGTSVFNRDTAEFQFIQGPIFTQVLLADEINRSTPKTQSALLEAMEEGQVTSDGKTRKLPDPFFVIATQNPTTQSGTYPLPESQLDRFLMRLSLGYPTAKAEREILLGLNNRERLLKIKPAMNADELVNIQQKVNDIHCSDSLIDYVQRLVSITRNSQDISCGLSPRGALALVRCAKTWALMDGRGHVVPEDVQMIFPSVVEHRLNASLGRRSDGSGVSQQLLEKVPVVV